MKRSHEGIASSEGHPQPAPGHPANPTRRLGDPRHSVCSVCGGPVHYRKRTYGPNGRAGGWSHTGDGLAQYRTW